jgi:acyl-coenzyme A thioesterase PaaI-like protein
MSTTALTERRRTAAILRQIIRELVTVDVDDRALAAVADTLETLRAGLANEPRLRPDVTGLHTKDHAGQHSGRTPLYDRDPLIGLSNPLAPPLTAVPGSELREWEVTFGDAYAGHPGFVHGGYVSAVLDHVLGVVSSTSGVATMTGTLTTRYRRPTPLGRRLVCRGTLDRVERRKVLCSAVLEADDGVIAEAEGIYIRVDPDRY